MTVTIERATRDDAAAIARVHVESWRTTYRGIVPDDVLGRLSVEPRERFWASIIANPDAPEFIYIAASSDGEIVGFASGGPERERNPDYSGELYAIYLLEQWQRQGIGRLLAAGITRTLLARGHESMLLWVLADNPYRAFYDRLGGVVIAEKRETFGGIELLEFAYGWSDLHGLQDALVTGT